MHIHGLDTKSKSWSPIRFNELGSWGERLNFSFQFQTERLKEPSSARERKGKNKGGRTMARQQWPKPPVRLRPGKITLSGSWFCFVNKRAYGPSMVLFCCWIIYKVCISVQDINIAMHSYFIQVICRVNWATGKPSEENEFHLITSVTSQSALIDAAAGIAF